MGSVESYPDHTFCWIDLGTNDAAGAKAFYGGLLGWEFDDLPTGEQGTYSICRLRGKAVAGLYDRAETPGWGSYVKVDDVDRATERARELGAEVLVAPFDAPGGGRVAMVRDPAGATVSLSRPGESFGAEVVNEDGAWTWNELVSGELAAGIGFYTGLFGWEAAELQGPIRRTSFTLGKLLIGGGHEPAPRSWAGRCCCRPWTSRSGGSPSWPTPRGPPSPPRPCPVGPCGASTGPELLAAG
jgi:predicted enzyme related to lactoylglutathione lyase